MIPTSALDAALHDAKTIMRELEPATGNRTAQPAVTMTSEDTFTRTSPGSTLALDNRAELNDPNHRRMGAHLRQGFALIRSGEYQAAREHFQDAKALKAMNVSIYYAGGEIKQYLPNTVAEAKKWIMGAARKNMAFNNNGSLSIRFANVDIAKPGTFGEIELANEGERLIQQHIQHEEALMAAEENIHTYQNLSGGKYITYQPKPGQHTEHDDEIDIAATFAAHNIPMTRDFLSRYRGRAEQVGNAEVWDLIGRGGGRVERVRVPACPPSSSLLPSATSAIMPTPESRVNRPVPRSLANLFQPPEPPSR